MKKNFLVLFNFKLIIMTIIAKKKANKCVEFIKIKRLMNLIQTIIDEN